MALSQASPLDEASPHITSLFIHRAISGIQICSLTLWFSIYKSVLVASSASPHKFTVFLSSHHRHWKKQPTHVPYSVSEVKCTFARAYSRELMKKPKSIKHFPSADKIKAKLLGVNIYKSLVVSSTQFLLSFRFRWSATEGREGGIKICCCVASPRETEKFPFLRHFLFALKWILM